MVFGIRIYARMHAATVRILPDMGLIETCGHLFRAWLKMTSVVDVQACRESGVIGRFVQHRPWAVLDAADELRGGFSESLPPSA